MAGLYIHIPFCRSKCAYCDFYSTPDMRWMERYIDMLLTEFSLRQNEIHEPFQTLYLGGGTPSLLPDKALTKLMEGLDPVLDLRQLEEITIEANPEDIDDSKIEFYQSLGINRVSIGIQSFKRDELQAVSRAHSASDSIKALNALSMSGINYNADLIYGMPGQNGSDWEDNLAQLLSYAPPHFSAYLLSYEPGTRLYARLLKGDVDEASDELTQSMYERLCDKARIAGYEHYEVSNFALPGRTARHNSLYWHYVPYLGLGAAAHSFDGKVRRFNPSSIKSYASKIEAGIIAFAEDDETLVNRFNDYAITSLRTTDGFDPNFALQKFSENPVERFMQNVRSIPDGTLELSATGHYVIPEKKWLTSDAVLRELIID